MSESTTDNTEESKKQELKQKVRDRVKCEEQAFRYVEKLSECTVHEAELIAIMQCITPEHYQDIIEERSIINICGYPICGNRTTLKVKQKYHISVRHNQVYDITDRKNFCSNVCLLASDHLKHQISDSPVWMRMLEKTDIKLLDRNKNRGKVGRSVTNNPHQAVKEELDLIEDQHTEVDIQSGVESEIAAFLCNKGTMRSSTDQASSEDQQLCQDIEHLNITGGRETVAVTEDGSKVEIQTKPAEKATSYIQAKKGQQLLNWLAQRDKLTDIQNTDIQNTDIQSTYIQNTDIQNTDIQKIRLENVHGAEDRVICTESKPVTVDISDSLIQTDHSKQTSVVRITSDSVRANIERLAKLKSATQKNTKKVGFAAVEHCLLEWKSKQTIDYLCDYLCDGADSKDREDEERNVKFAAMSQRAEVLQKFLDSDSDDLSSDDDNATPSGKLPEFAQLRKDTETFNVKVQDFYKGQMSKISDNKELDAISETQGDIKENDRSKVWTPVMPLVDSRSQMSLRRRIVLDKLNKILPDVLTPLQLSITEVAPDLRLLVHSFQLGSNNITLRPAEWNIMTLLMLHILSLRVPSISAALSDPDKSAVYNKLFASCQISVEQVTSLLYKISH